MKRLLGALTYPLAVSRVVKLKLEVPASARGAEQDAEQIAAVDVPEAENGR